MPFLRQTDSLAYPLCLILEALADINPTDLRANSALIIFLALKRWFSTVLGLISRIAEISLTEHPLCTYIRYVSALLPGIPAIHEASSAITSLAATWSSTESADTGDVNEKYSAAFSERAWRRSQSITLLRAIRYINREILLSENMISDCSRLRNTSCSRSSESAALPVRLSM